MAKQLFAAVLPLVLFWAIEEFWGLKAALIAGCVAAVAEIVWERTRQGRVGFLTWMSNILVLGLGAISFYMDSGVAFKLQPTVMQWASAVMLGAMRLKRFGGEPFLLKMFRESPMLDAAKRDTALGNSVFVARLRAADTRLLIFFVLHGAVMAWAAIWGSTRLWILLKGVLFYVLLVLVMLPLYRNPGRKPQATPVPE